MNHSANSLPTSHPRYAVSAEWMCDGSGKSFQRDATVIVEDDRIVDIIFPSQQITPSSELVIYRFEGATLVPGLIDAHVHLTLDPSVRDLIQDHADTSDEQLFDRSIRNAGEALAAGVTTVRDLGGRNDVCFKVKAAIQKELCRGPHLQVAGRPLTCLRGHLYYMGGEVSTTEDAIRLIRRQAERGADLTKVVATGGGLTPGTGLMRAQFSSRELAAIVSESHHLGLPVAAHVGWGPAIRACAECAVDTLEHCTFITPTGLLIDETVLEIVRERRPYIVTTKYQFLLNKDRTETFGNLKAEVDRTFAQMYEDTLVQLARFREVGLKVVAGSDAGIVGMQFSGVIGEIKMLELAGYPPVEALAAATGIAAGALHVDDDRGIVRKGFRADLLVVRGPVHESTDHLRHTLLVIKDGRISYQAN